MKAIDMRIITLFVVGILLLSGCSSESTNSQLGGAGSDHLIMGEGVAGSNGLSVTNGNVVIKKGRPGIAFTFATLPNQSRELKYFLVFSHDFPNSGVATRSGGDDLKANASHTIKSFGNECNAEYHVELDAESKTVASDSTVIGDAPYDLSQGKLFLIDMKNSPPAVTQLKIEFPSEIPDLKLPGAAEKFGEKTLDSLRKSNKAVEAFCRRIER